MPKPRNDPFGQKKRHVLAQVALTDKDHPDASPKGTIDEHLLPLIRLINSHPDMFTTSSCSGRVSVFLEGDKSAQGFDKIGGKGAGGKWLFVTHDPELDTSAWLKQVKEYREEEITPQSGDPVTPQSDGSKNPTDPSQPTDPVDPVHSANLVDPVGPVDPTSPTTRHLLYKFEAMILHVKCRDLPTATALYTAAMACGFRESGIGSNNLVAIRISLKLDVPLGYLDPVSNSIVLLVSDNYISHLDSLSLARFAENFRRRDSLYARIQSQLFPPVT